MPKKANSTQYIKPFFTYSDSLPKLLYELNCTIALSTYQAGKLILISSHNGVNLRQFGKNFKRPMGVCLKGNQLAIAEKASVHIFNNVPTLAKKFPKKDANYDAMFIPQASFYTAYTDIHDIAWGKNDTIWAVNTAFSCLVTLDLTYSFTPMWQPPFISELMPEDRCHLNGLAMQNGQPAYVTMLGPTNEKDGWRQHKVSGGLLMHVPSNTIIFDDLGMPHSPRLHGNLLYFLQSATGKLMVYDTETKVLKTLSTFSDFARGMDIIGDYLFVGTSAIRKNSKSFVELPIAQHNCKAGMLVINRHTGVEVARLTYTERIHEVFDIGILPNACNAGILEPRSEISESAIHSTNGISYWIKIKNKKKNVKKS